MSQIHAQQQVLDMGAHAAGLARAQTRGTQSLIRVVDRDLKRIEAKAKEEANLLGSLGFYGWGNGKDRVEGPSWELAKALIRVYGNCSLDMEPVQDLPDSWIMTARVVDLETGYSISRQFRQSKKWAVHGKFDEARKEDIRFQIGQSKSLRNVVLSFLPGWLVDRALDASKGGVRELIESAIAKNGMEAVVARCIQRCERIGVDEARLLDCMGRKTRQAITVEDLVIIQGGISVVESGQDTAESVFPAVTVDPQAGAPNTRTEEVLTKIRNSQASTNEPSQSGEAPGSASQPPAPAAPGAQPVNEEQPSLGDADAQPPADFQTRRTSMPPGPSQRRTSAPRGNIFGGGK